MQTLMILSILLVLAAFALPALFRAGEYRRRFTLLSAANTYDAAVETHEGSVRRTNDSAVSARHLLWTQGASDTSVDLATASTIPLGTIDNTESSTGLGQTVLLLGGDCTRKMVANGAISAGDRVFAAASGKVSGGGVVYLGIALTAAAADGDILEVLTTVPTLTSLTETVTATNIITAGETGKTFFLNSATEFVSTLPAPAAGLRFDFLVTAAPSGASYTIVTASSANIIKGLVLSSDLNNASDADFETSGGDTISFVDGAAVAGDRVSLISDGANWFATGFCTAQGGITITTAS